MSEPDLPPPPDLGEPDMAPPPDLGEPDADQVDLGCDTDAECGPNSACAAGTCVDLLTDPKNCGLLGRACPASPGSTCSQGVCTCGELDAAQPRHDAGKVLVMGDGDIRSWPAAELTAYPSKARFVCSTGEPVDDCMGELVPDTNYPLDAPHFVAVYASKQDEITLRTINGRGEPSDISLPYKSTDPANDGEDRMLSYQIIPVSEEHFTLFVLWEPGLRENTRRVLHSYTVTSSATAPSKLAITRDNLPAATGKPLRWLEQPDLTDFSLSAVDIPFPAGATTTALIFSYTFGSTNGPNGIGVRGYYNLPNGGAGAITLESPTNLTSMYQLSSGFSSSATIVTPPGAPPRLHVAVTTLEPTPDGEATAPEPSTGFTQRYYTQRVFSGTLDMNNPRSIVLHPSDAITPRSVGSTIAAGFSFISLLFGDLSRLPPPMISFITSQDSAEAPIYAHLGWTRTREANAQDTTNFVVSSTSLDGITLKTLVDRSVYDYALFEQGSTSVILWLDTQIADATLGNLARPVVATLTGFDDANSTPGIGVERPLGTPFPARRISTAPSPHATGVLVSGINEVRFYLLADDQPTCK